MAALRVRRVRGDAYLNVYDLVVLVVPIAFLLRLGNARGYLSKELIGIALACGLILIFPFVKFPVGVARGSS